MVRSSDTAISIKIIFFRKMALIALVSVIFWSLTWISFEYAEFLAESDSIRKLYLESQKSILKTEVTNLISYITKVKNSIQNGENRDQSGDNDHQRCQQNEDDEILQRIVYLRFGTEGYFFGSTTAGEPLFSNGTITRGGQNLLDLTDPDGIKIIQEQKKAAEQPGGGFVHYRWKKLDSDQPSHKLSFVMSVPSCNWIVGAGLYLDTMEATITAKKEALKSGLINKLTVSIFILCALLLLIFYWANHIARQLHRSIFTFSSFFEKAATDMVTIDLHKLPFREFQEIASGANRMIIEKQLALEEKIKLEQQLRQSHKMEAIGTLAGGIAHDINNILSVIIGNAELAIYDIDSFNPIFKNIEAIRNSSLNAKNIVRQLLSFSRQTDEKKIPVNINGIVRDSVTLLRSSISSSIAIMTELTPEEPFINANPTQIHQILLNLCSNAAHAMEEKKGGVLNISTQVIEADNQQNILLEVEDNGHGIETEIMEKIFDPYFTTKETGKGTGMGLAVVHGIIQNHHGTISVKSSPGHGTTFDIIFPFLHEPHMQTTFPTQGELPTGEGNILFVDDDESLAEMEKEFLERLGYIVTVCTEPEKALALFTADPEAFHLLITDMTMPVMNGKELIRKILDLKPDMLVILCTGYHDKINESSINETGATRYFEKPVDNIEFARAIQELLIFHHKSGFTVKTDSDFHGNPES